MDTETTVCPECGRPLAGVDIDAHADDHWPVPLDDRKPAYRTAILRRNLLLHGGVSPTEYAVRDTAFTI